MPNLLDRLTRELKAHLIVAGFDIETQTDKKLTLNVHVSEFDPGSAALRLSIGFGAGRGWLLYSAEYADDEGKSLQGWTVRNILPEAKETLTITYGAFATLGGEEKVREILVKEAGKHITELAAKTGS